MDKNRGHKTYHFMCQLNALYIATPLVLFCTKGLSIQNSKCRDYHYRYNFMKHHTNECFDLNSNKKVDQLFGFYCFDQYQYGNNRQRCCVVVVSWRLFAMFSVAWLFAQFSHIYLATNYIYVRVYIRHKYIHANIYTQICLYRISSKTGWWSHRKTYTQQFFYFIFS